MTTAASHSNPCSPVVVCSPALPAGRGTGRTAPAAGEAHRPAVLDAVADAVRRAGRWAADELRAGAEMSARRDAVRTADENRFRERP